MLPEPKILQETIKKKEVPFFSGAQTATLLTVCALFVVSGAWPLIPPLMMAWYVGAAAGIAVFVVGLIVGFIRAFHDGGRFLSSTFVMILIIMSVGAGTCAFNIGGLEMHF